MSLKTELAPVPMRTISCLFDGPRYFDIWIFQVMFFSTSSQHHVLDGFRSNLLLPSAHCMRGSVNALLQKLHVLFLQNVQHHPSLGLFLLSPLFPVLHPRRHQISTDFSILAFFDIFRLAAFGIHPQ